MHYTVVPSMTTSLATLTIGILTMRSRTGTTERTVLLSEVAMVSSVGLRVLA